VRPRPSVPMVHAGFAPTLYRHDISTPSSVFISLFFVLQML
jgi:hypothetical protein